MSRQQKHGYIRVGPGIHRAWKVELIDWAEVEVMAFVGRGMWRWLGGGGIDRVDTQTASIGQRRHPSEIGGVGWNFLGLGGDIDWVGMALIKWRQRQFYRVLEVASVRCRRR
mmetsp:Transcript_11772/g.18654  ORF Transcript_11772/g.18654 Transcript_11772/m.18654 type:complete len:112 (+) Transcript_11772:352-687(+)